MRNKKRSDSDAAALIAFFLIMLVLTGLLFWTYFKNISAQEEFKEFMEFNIEFNQYVFEKYNISYEAELENFLKYKTDELLNNFGSNIKETE